MSSETGSANLELPDAYYRRLFSLIPARSLRSIINELARVWAEATGANAVYLAVFDRGGSTLTAAISRLGHNETECFVDETIQVSKECLFHEQAQSVFEQGRSFTLISSEPFEFLAIPCEHFDLAGIFLFSDTKISEASSLVSDLIQVSHRLLVQVTCSGSSASSDSNARELEASDLNEAAGENRRVFPDVDKLEAMAEFAAGAGHEINNPVATIVGRVQMLLKGETDPDRRQSLTTIGGQAYRVRDMIGDAMLFARPPVPRPVSLNFHSAIEDVLTSLEREITQSGIQVSLEVSESHLIWADEVQCKVVLSNLILNCLNVLESEGHLQIVTEEVVTGSERMLQIRVIDDGPGLTEEEKEHLFDPFYSARQAGRGLGFGLSKCWRIISLHGGQIEVENNVDCGVTVYVMWPTANSSDLRIH